MTGGLKFDNWLFGPEKFSGLSRNGPQGNEKMVRLGLRAIVEHLNTYAPALCLPKVPEVDEPDP